MVSPWVLILGQPTRAQTAFDILRFRSDFLAQRRRRCSLQLVDVGDEGDGEGIEAAEEADGEGGEMRLVAVLPSEASPGTPQL